MKDDKPLRIFKAAAYIAVGAAMAFVFVRNAFPVTGEAFVLEVSSDHSGSSQSPFTTDLSEASANNETSSFNSSVIYSSEQIPPEASSDAADPENSDPSSAAESSSVASADSGSAPMNSQITSSSEQSAGMININTASSSELQRLTGIGEVKARAIIEYREQNGGFSSVDELINVKGIGEKTLEKIRDKITI